MTLVGDVIKAVFSGTLAGTNWNLVQYYLVDAITDSANFEAFVAKTVGDKFIDQLLPNLVDELVFTNVRTDNITNGLLTGNYSTSATGGRADDINSSFASVALKQIVSTKLTRDGYKFLPGIPDSEVASNLVSAPYQTVINTAANDLFDGTVTVLNALSASVGDIAACVVGRVKNPATGKYELDLAKVQRISNAQCLGTIRSRVSRRVKT